MPAKPEVGLRVLKIKYELKCIMVDNTVERRLIEEFGLIPFKKSTTGVVDYMNHFIFENRKYYISDIQPNFEDIFKMNVKITRKNPDPPLLGNEGMLQIEIRHLEKMKPIKDVTLQTL